jgi:UDP-N-acetylglucosamine:LPS N-acetylglucosamine transferase
MIVQSAFTVNALSQSVARLLDDPRILADRSQAVLARARPHAADDIARRVLELANRKTSP